MLRSYTSNLKFVEIDGNTVKEVFINLDKKFPGIKFRFIDERNQVRAHMRVYLNQILIEDFNKEVDDTDEIFITQSLSGGNLTIRPIT
ncbi:MAG: hypothetical protein HeimC2_20640 [Candidatus Heimdallarchaeota archaeon LC_2]|nr:MAG: hypothetical protein HeimC2_20640 [Candidatus Heimdallarchaeota archaeon LC_2]